MNMHSNATIFCFYLGHYLYAEINFGLGVGYVRIICTPKCVLYARRGRRYVKNISQFFLNITISRFYHDSLSCWSEQYSQTNFPIKKTNPFKVKKYKKEQWIFRPKWAKMRIFVLILSLLLKK